MTSRGMTGLWRSSRRTRHTLSMRVLNVEPVLTVPGTQDLSIRGRVQKRRRSVTWCELATMEGFSDQENHDGWNSTGDSCSGCSSGTSGSFGPVTLSPSWLIQAKPPPPEAGENLWPMLVKSPPNSEEQWKRGDSPIPSWFGSNGLREPAPPPLRKTWMKRPPVKRWSTRKVRQSCHVDHSVKQRTCRRAFSQRSCFSRCGGPFQTDRRPAAQFVMTRSTSSRCVKALSGSRCARMTRR